VTDPVIHHEPVNSSIDTVPRAWDHAARRPKGRDMTGLGTSVQTRREAQVVAHYSRGRSGESGAGFQPAG
jgi:hypothetical protein